MPHPDDLPPQWTRDPRFGCLLWSGRLSPNGYPQVNTPDGPRMAHLERWRASGRPKPEYLDHLCRRITCVSLAHLESVSQSENLRRKAWAYRVARQRCGAGHDLFEHGLRTPEAGIVCRVCSGVWTPEDPSQVS